MSEPLDPHAVDAPVLDGIAIVGMAGRFPGARTLDDFWRNLRAGVESVSFFSAEELIAAGVPRTLVERPDFVRAKAALAEADAFDAAFFGYLPAEAEMTDPQQRIFLECAWAALEDAGYDPAAAPGLVGIFGGMSQSAYLALVKQADPAGEKYSGYPLRLGTDKDYLTTRVSYKLNLRGPSISVQTACSSSLVAVCQACQSLLSYQCDTALAGGVSVTLPLKSGHVHQEGGIHSADGHCRPFDHRSSGIVEGEGVGIVVLKRLADALADGDTIHAVIKGFGLGNDGSGKVGFTAPSPDGQAEAIGAALALAGVPAETITYVEAHGTGTPLGDPIEIAGLTKAFRAAGAERDQFCAIGSVKSNIGHLDTAAGIAGLIKTVLALRHRELPPSLHFTQPNPAIDFARSPFLVNHTLREWRTDGVPRRAGVSSFGLGGTNAHVVIEEPPAIAGDHDAQAQRAFVLPLSARTTSALDAASTQLAEALAAQPDLSLADVAFTLQHGRHAFNERRVIVAADAAEARDLLSGSQPRRVMSGTAIAAGGAGKRPVVFLFPGQGAQQVDMGREIYEREPVFRDAVDRSAALLRPHLGCDLRDVIYPSADREAAQNALTQTWLTQPALFVIEHALATQLMAWGIVPEAMVGHSVGEYVAACLSGVLTLEDALHLLATRARLMQDLPAGSMLAVRLAEFELQPLLDATLSLAAANGPTASVVSGPTTAIAALEATLTARGVACRRLATSHAFHSGMMDPIASPFTAVVNGIRRGRPSIPYLSNVTSRWITEADVADPSYWFEHLRRPVRFGDSLAELARDPRRVLLEVGPGHALAQLARQHPARPSAQVIASTLVAEAGQGEHQALLAAAGRLWTAGVDLRWDALQPVASRRRVSLPTYPFEKKRHWPTAPAAPAEVSVSAAPVSETESLPSERAMTAMTRPNDRTERIRREMVRVLHELSGMDQDQFADDKSFLELGFDSLFLGQASLAFQKTFGVRVRFREFFESAPTPGDMVRLLDERMPADKFADAPAPAAPAPTAAPPAAATVAPASPVVTPPVPAPAPVAAAPFVPTPAIALPAPAPTIASGADASLIERIVAQQLQVVLEVTRQQLAAIGQAAPTVASVAPVAPAVPPSAPTKPVVPPSAAAKPATDAKTTPMKVFAQAIVNDPSGIVWQPLERAASGGPTPRQQRAIDELIASYCAKTARSKALTQEMRPYLADPRAIVGFAPVWKETVYQICSERSQGGRMWDVDGNEWLDVTLGFGASAYGHSPAFVVDAIKAQLDKGMELGTQSQLSADVGRLFCELTGHERVCFCTAGTEAVMGALRLARAYTGRDRFAMFNGDTHGRLDEVLGRPVVVNNEYSALPAAAGIAPHSVKPTLFLEFGNPKSLEVIEQYADELAAVLVEPIRTRSPDLQPIEFLHAMRALTRKHGIIFIMDEVVTGFRVHQGGAQRLLGIEPDLSTWGKAVAGGMPIGVISGKAEYMDALDGGFWQYGDDSVPEARMTNFGGAGTFSRHPLSMAAAWATLSHVKSEGPDLQERTSRKAERFVTTLNATFRRERLPIHIERFRTFWAPRVLGDRKFEPLLFVYLRNEGIHIYVDYPCYICTAHTDEEVDELIARFARAVEKMHAAGLLPEPPPDAPPTGGGGAPREREGERGRAAASDAVSVRERAPEPAVTLGHRSLMGPSAQHATGPPTGDGVGTPARAASFSMYFFGNSPAEYAPDKYDLIVEAARFADAQGFSAVMFPERHFHPVGGFSPNPVLLAAALALETTQTQLRGASVVLPLHEPIRVAEEWSVVDNLSGGRVGISIASGWHPNDFVFHPDRYERRRELCVEGLRTIRTLWRGDALPVVGGTGNALSVRLHPQPKQSDLPVWFTCSQGSSYEHAGALGVHVLGMLTNQSLDEVAARIAQYRAARAAHGFDPDSGRVTMLVHTFVGPDADIARRVARGPMREYLRSYLDNSQKRHDAQGRDTGLDPDDIEFLLDRAFEDYVKEKAFLGSPDSCVAVAERLASLGIDEFACFVDFGVDPHTVRANLRYIAELKEAYEARVAATREHETPRAAGATRESGAIYGRGAVLGSAAAVGSGASPQSAAAFESATADHLPPLPGERGQGVRGGRRDDGSTVRQLPLTPGQTEIWLASRLGDDSANAFHQSASIELTGPLDKSALQRALQQLIARHEALRITIAPDGDAQIIHPALAVAIAEIDLIALADASAPAPAPIDRALAEIVARDLATPFDLVDGPLLRATAVRLAPDRHQLIVSACHIICDGWSLGIMLRDLSTLYSAAVEGTRAELPVVMPFTEYLAWREQPEQREEETRAEDYWLAQFSGAVPVLDLPGDRPRPRFKTYNGASEALQLDAAYLGTLRRAATKRGLTVFSAAVGAYATLLHRLSGQDDLVIGLAAAGQPAAGHDDLVGHCVSLLPYRVRLTGETAFGAQLAAVRSGLLDAFDHQACTYGSLIGRIKTPRDTSRLPLVSTVVTHELDTPGVRFAGLDHRIVWNPKQHCNFDLELYLTESAADGLRATLCYNTDLFDASTVARWLGHLQVLLDAFIDGTAGNQLETPVDALPLLTAADRTRMLERWNDTDVAYPQDETLHALVAAQAARTPQAPALTFESETLTYADLDRRATALAAHLQAFGVGDGTLVGIAVERSIEMVVGLLGILKAGGAYVPIDPTYPADRLAFMLQDADVPVLLTQQRLRAALPVTRAQVIALDQPLPAAPAGATVAATPTTVGSAASLAYMIYTSGSTGRPKGALNAHRGIVNRLRWMQDAYQLTAQDAVLQKTPFSFDVSVWEFFWPLITGARLVIARPGGHQDPEYLAQLIARERISIIHFVPSMLRAFLDGARADDCRTLRDVICSGEALPGDLVEAFFRTFSSTRLHNLYGPTEAAVDVTAWECPRDFRGTVVPIGRPIANTRCYILDARQQPAPIGLPGELHLGGVQVGRGYHQRPELTAERFIRDPFSSDPDARLYRTGDLCRYLADGTIEFLGRIDHQVKIRGFRIELGEIEAAIAEHPAIAQAVVLAREDAPGEKRLVAYLVPRGAQAADAAPADLTPFLAARLPNYMVPSAFVVLPALPLSPNGKVDRKALPAPERGAVTTQASYAAPRTAREQELAEIWASVLRLARVGLDDNFFEIGGDSILAIQIATRARRAGWTIAPRQFFQYQTVRELTAVAMPTAAAADSAAGQTADAAQGEPTGAVRLSPIQRWFLDQEIADAHHWNQSLLLEIADAGAAIDPAALEAALNDVVRHHDALRLRFTKQDDAWTQEYAASDAARATSDALSASPVVSPAASSAVAPVVSLVVDKVVGISDEELRARVLEITARAQASLDLERARLVSAAYFDRGAAHPGLLFVAVHHLAIDGVSWQILLEDLELAYRRRRAGEAVALPAKSWSFQRWVERLAAQADSEAVAASAGYWTSLPAQFASPLPPDAPDAASTADVEASTATIVTSLPADRTADLLQRVPAVYNTQINDVLLAALLLGFHRRTGADALLLHLEGHGREDLGREDPAREEPSRAAAGRADQDGDADVSRTVGWFTSLFPVHLRRDGLSDPGALLRHVKEQLRQTPQRGLGYGLLRYLASSPETRAAVAAHAAPAVAFNYFGQVDGWLADSTLFRRSDLRTAPDHGPRARRLMPLEVNARVLGGQLEFHWSFGRNRHRHETIEALASATLQALQDLVAHCLSPQAGGVTPSDFPSANLSQEALDDLLAELGESSS